jgi:hypothetical protein
MHPGTRAHPPPATRPSTGTEVAIILLRVAATPITLVVMVGVFVFELLVFVPLYRDDVDVPGWLPAVLPTPVLAVMVGIMVLLRLRDWVPLELPLWPLALLVPLWLTDLIDLGGETTVVYGIGVGIVGLAMTVRIAAFHWINHRRWSVARSGGVHA